MKFTIIVSGAVSFVSRDDARQTRSIRIISVVCRHNAIQNRCNGLLLLIRSIWWLCWLLLMQLKRCWGTNYQAIIIRVAISVSFIVCGSRYALRCILRLRNCIIRIRCVVSPTNVVTEVNARPKIGIFWKILCKFLRQLTDNRLWLAMENIFSANDIEHLNLRLPLAPRSH